MQPVLNLKGRFINKQKQIRRLTSLLQDNKFVMFPSESGIEILDEIPRALATNFIKEYAEIFGTIRLRQSTTRIINYRHGVFLLFTPQALLKIPDVHTEYLSQLRHKTRTVINKAERLGYEFKEFHWNDHLDDVFRINTSKEIRQSEPMRGWYRDPVEPRFHSAEEAPYHKYIGGFKDGTLYAYFYYWVCGKFAVGKHFIGHVDHLTNGIMNGLLSWTVKNCIERSNLKWITYGSWQESSLGEFKKHSGFEEYAMLIDATDDPDLTGICKIFNRSVLRI